LRYTTFFLLFIISFSISAQDWWTKTKIEAVPADLKSTDLLVQRFKKRKLNDAPPSAFMDKDNQKEHPLIKKTNNNLEKYNDALRSMFKSYKFESTLCSVTKAKDAEKYPYANYKYVLKQEVYLRKYQKNGMNQYFYTYVFYFHDRETDKDFPYIYLFDEQRLKSLEKLIGYLNTL